jgi:predicted DNA-binding transcriptional regulator AlpA
MSDSASRMSENPRRAWRQVSLTLRPRSVGDMKMRQSAKIRELGQALTAAGIVSLDAQAKVLGLSRSTTWTLLKGNHKGSGLSIETINRMLTAQHLPPAVRVKLLEYVQEKAFGCYGHSERLRRRFIDKLAAKRVNLDYLRDARRVEAA